MTAGRRAFAAVILLPCALWAQTADGAISGTVRNASTHLPLDGAQVSLIGENSSGAETDARGGFRFTGLGPGTYTLRIEKLGFTGGKPSKVELHAGSAVDNVTVDLYPLARIEGRVVDEEGAPMAGVLVETTNAPVRAPATDGNGRFELTNLYPRDYVIRLWLPAASRTAGYPAMEFYPGVTDMAQAASVHVEEGAQIAGFHIKLRKVALVNLRGRIVDVSKSSPVVEAALDCEPGPIAGSYARRPVVDGRFHFEDVPPGRHTLLVFRGTGPDDLPYRATVDAGNDEVPVAVPAFANLQGVVKSRSGGPWEGVLGIGLGPAGGTAGAWRHNVVPDEDGAFTLPEVPPGEWDLRLESNSLQAQGRKLRLASARFGAVNALDKALPVTEGGNPPIAITLSGESGSIAGTVEGDDPHVVESIVFAVRMAGGSKEPYETARTGPDGSFLMSDLLPGEYQIAAGGMTVSGQGVVGADCTGRIGKVTVTDGQTATVKLKRCGQ